jgi:hypothetical protein
MQIVTVQGGNLYQLAAQFLQDATQFLRIMQMNNLTDPMLPPTQITLVIPDVDLSQTGGVPAQ